MPGIERTMHEYKHGTLHSGSKTGPKVTSRDQAVAIGLNEEREMGQKVKPPPSLEALYRAMGHR